MKRAYRFIVVLGILLIAAVPATADDKLMKECVQIGDRMAKAMLADDIDAIMEMYLDDAISMPSYSPMVEGKEAMLRNHEEMTASGMKVIAFESDTTRAWQAGDEVIEIGTFKITLEVPGMPMPIKDHGKYLTVYERQQDGSLKIKVETWNSDINPMTMGSEHHEHPPGS